MVNADTTLAVNLGCGTTVASGWVNIDNSPNARLSKIPLARRLFHSLGLLSDAHTSIEWPSDLVIRDLRRPLPFGNDTVDYIYTSHTMEHLTKDEATKLLREIKRVLRPGGVVRIVVPDLEHYVHQYVTRIATDPTDAQAAPDFLQSLHLLDKARSPHRWMYDTASLRALLENEGYEQVVLCGNKAGSTPDLEVLDVRPEDSIHFEAIKS